MIPMIAIDGCCIILIMNHNETNQMIANVTGEKSMAGIKSNTGSSIR